jgi:hypothetical protein
MRDKTDEIIKQIHAWDLYAKVTPAIGFVALIVFWVSNLFSLDFLFYASLAVITVSSVVWWFWAIYTILYLISILKRTEADLEEVSQEMKKIKEDVKFIDENYRNR